RHDSLIPLSRQHQYALMLCLRINRGLPEHGHDQNWLREKREQVFQFFEGDLAPHFTAEEEVLFPAMREQEGAALLLDELLTEHRKLEALALRMRSYEGGPLAAALKELAVSLEKHIRKEERQLFPIYEQQVSAGLARTVEQEIINHIGTALHPRNPDLLK
ncbi:MAG TPA: hemerythrin domain-containing protein, partial [Blastocatellia bacterium]|nr:hemerythrin domain-containing protein [Blastocatellia bacterium]